MVDVQFGDEQNGGGGSLLYAKFERSSNEPPLVSWLIKSGMVKSEKGANTILIGFILCMLGVAVYFSFFFGHSPVPQKVPGSGTIESRAAKAARLNSQT